MTLNELALARPTDPRLSKVSRILSVRDIASDKTQDLISAMLDMAAGKGKSSKDSRQMVGLSAVQVGQLVRIILIDLTADGSNKDQDLQVVINPAISARSSEMVDGREGCWSCGNVCGNVSRHKSVNVTGFDRTGGRVSYKFTGFVARIAQHEVDHLDGIRFPERIPKDEPYRLHWVEHSEFELYRTKWSTWPKLCDRQVWENIKLGRKQ